MQSLQSWSGLASELRKVDEQVQKGRLGEALRQLRQLPEHPSFRGFLKLREGLILRRQGIASFSAHTLAEMARGLPQTLPLRAVALREWAVSEDRAGGDYEEAGMALKEAMEIFDFQNDSEELASVFFAHALIELRRGHYEHFVQLAEEAGIHHLFGQTKLPIGEADITEKNGMILISLPHIGVAYPTAEFIELAEDLYDGRAYRLAATLLPLH